VRVRVAATLLALAGCYDPAVKLGVPCSDDGTCPAGQECDQLTNICMAPTEVLTWREDSAADFMQTGATLTSAIVESGGFVSPRPYATGRIRLSAIASDTIGTAATATWATASNGPITGRSFTNGLNVDYASDPPYGLGLASGDNVTVLVEGEINLDATGVWRFNLDANDKGFVEIAAPNGQFTRLVDDTNTGTTVNYTVTTTGWHTIRGAFSDVMQLMAFNLTADSPAMAGGLLPVEVDRVRAPVEDLQGYVTDAFDEGGMLDYLGTTLDTQPLMRSLPTDAYGIPVGIIGFAFRWSAQVLIETEGDYGFALSSFQGHRMWVDGVQVANTFSTLAMASSMSTVVRLEPGWHDIVVDVSKEDANNMPGSVSVTVASGPAWVGQPIPIANVRPVVGRSQRWTEAAGNTAATITDGMTITRNLTLQIPVGFVPTAIEAGYQIDHPIQAQVSVVLDPPVGTNVTMLAAGGLSGAGAHNDHQSISVTDFGATWQFIVGDDTVDAMTGQLEYHGITALGSGGVAPFPTQSRFESAVHELGNVVGFGPATWTLRQGTTVTVEMRSCDDAAACASESWTPVTAGAVPPIPARRFAQYAVTIATNGDVPTAFDSFELTYSARPE